MNKFTVSIGIVAFNEEQYLPSLFNDIKAQTFPSSRIEIILINSDSSDKTLHLMERFRDEEIKNFKNIKVLDNPQKKQAAGWNIAIKNFTCDVLVRIDAHAKLPIDFITTVMEVIESGENVAGGPRPCLITNPNSWTNTLLQAENSMFGSSINRHYKDSEKQYVKTMFHAAYRRQVFETIGGFNENLGRTEDNELHYRIRKAGYKLCFDRHIISYQYARSSLKKMLKQKYSNGYWIGLTLGVCPGCLSIFHFVPFLFVTAIMITIIFSFIGIFIPGILLSATYITAAIIMSIVSIKENSFTNFSFLLPILFFLLHISYGIGTYIGIIMIPFKRNYLKMQT